MDNLRSEIAVARDIAAQHEGDIRIKELLQAINIWLEGGDDKPVTLEVACHFRSWQKSVTPIEAARLAAMFQAGLAEVLAGWVQSAIRGELLSLSDPPRTVGKEAFSVGGIMTFVYDRGCMLVGKRWT